MFLMVCASSRMTRVQCSAYRPSWLVPLFELKLDHSDASVPYVVSTTSTPLHITQTTSGRSEK